jgi:hypothetical protein
MDRWTDFRDAVGRLSVRHKPSLELWQRLLGPIFVDLGDETAIRRALIGPYTSAAQWCAGNRVDEGRARLELQRTLDFLSQMKGETMSENRKLVHETPAQRLERVNKFVSNAPTDMPREIRNRILTSALDAFEQHERRERFTEILETL